MSDKNFRELQVSSSQLVVIFLAILILGLIVFLLGVSVGKKQTEIVLDVVRSYESHIREIHRYMKAMQEGTK